MSNRSNTAIGAKMNKAGVRAEVVEFEKALAKFLNNGGSIAEARECVERAAEQLSRGGHEQCADEAWYRLPATGHADSGDGAEDHVPDGQRRTAPSHRTGDGHRRISDKADGAVPSARPSPKQPSAAQREAARSVAKQSAHHLTAKMGWLGDATVPGGPKYTDLRWRDIDGMIRRQMNESGTHARAMIALTAIQKAGERILGQPDPESFWANDLPPDVVAMISNETEPDVLIEQARGWLEGWAQSVQARMDADVQQLGE